MKNVLIFLLFLTLSTNLIAQSSKEVAFGSITLKERSVNDYIGGPYSSESIKDVMSGLNNFIFSKGYTFIGEFFEVLGDNNNDLVVGKLTKTTYTFKNTEKKKTITIKLTYNYAMEKARPQGRAVNTIIKNEYTLILWIQNSETIKEADL